MWFRVLWIFDALIGLVFLGFFVAGVADRSVSSFNLALWLGILAVLGSVILGSLWLRRAGHRGLALGVLLMLAAPGLLALLFLAVLLVSHPRWN